MIHSENERACVLGVWKVALSPLKYDFCERENHANMRSCSNGRTQKPRERPLVLGSSEAWCLVIFVGFVDYRDVCNCSFFLVSFGTGTGKIPV